MKRLISLILALVFGFGLVAGAAPAVNASSSKKVNGVEQAQQGVDSINGGNNSVNLVEIVSTILNAVFLVVGIIAVVVIIIGGINYMTSQGDPGKVKKAKDTILYGIIGLVITLLAFAIVSFVIGALQK